MSNAIFYFSGRRSVFLFLMIAFLGATVSLISTGFKFGIGNNVFHIPYVLRFGELPVFYEDAFYQSLEKFTSLVWPLLRPIIYEENIEKVFFISHILSRVVAFISLCWFFGVNGASRLDSILISIIVCAVCPWMKSGSVIGAHGLFISYFTHSEVTWGPLVAALVAAQLGRLTLAAIFSGIVFSINAFVGIWLVAIILVCVLMNKNQRTDFKLFIKSMLIFLLICIPVMIWIIASIGAENSVSKFSYIEYIRVYYPAHFLIEAVSFRDLRDFFIIAYCGIVAALLNENKKFWTTTLVVCFTLIVIGSILPYIFNNKFIFNLHFLRIAGVLQFLAIVLMISTFVNVLTNSRNGVDLRVVAVLAVGSLMSLKSEPLYLLICALCLSYLLFNKCYESGVLFKFFPKFSFQRKLIPGALFFLAIAVDFLYIGAASILILKWILISSIIFFILKRENLKNRVVASVLWIIFGFIVVLVTFWGRDADFGKLNEKKQSNIEMTKWVKESRLVGPFLFPVDDSYRDTFNEFQLQTQRTVWVDWKQGAAVMWMSSFYWQWMPRFLEVKSLKTEGDFVNYAIKNKIPNIVFPLDVGDCRGGTKEVFKNAKYVICSVNSN